MSISKQPTLPWEPVKVIHTCYYHFDLQVAEDNFVAYMNDNSNPPGCECEYNLFYWYGPLTDELKVFLGLCLKEGAASSMCTIDDHVSIVCGIELPAAKHFARIYQLDVHPRTYPGFNMVLPQELIDKVAELLALRR